MAKHAVSAEIRDALAVMLELDDAAIAEAIVWTRQAGYTLDEVPGRIIEAVSAIPFRGKRGPKAANALRAAIFDGAPNSTGTKKSEAGFFRDLRQARDAGIAEADLGARRRARTAREVADECEGWLIKHGLRKGQQGFCGSGWGFDSPKGV